MDNIITLQRDDEEIDVEVIEQTTLNGVNYLLVSEVVDENEDEEYESEAYILKDNSSLTDEDANYEFVEDEDLLEELYTIFSDNLIKDNIDLQK